MSSSTYDPPVDSAVAACAQITAGLDVLAGLPAELVGGAAVRQVIDTMMVGRSRTAGLLARYLGQAESRSLYPPVGGGHPTAAWLRHRYRLRPKAATWWTGRWRSCPSCPRSVMRWSTAGPTSSRPTWS